MAAKRGPDGRFLTKEELAAEAQQVQGTVKTNNNRSKNTMSEIEFVDELPKIDRKRESGVWVERLEPLRDNVMRWAKVYGPTKNPHAVIANVTNGAAGVDDIDWFEFAGRTFETEETEVNEEGEEVPVREGYVFARYMDDERKVERDQELAEKRAKRDARETEKANA